MRRYNLNAWKALLLQMILKINSGGILTEHKLRKFTKEFGKKR